MDNFRITKNPNFTPKNFVCFPCSFACSNKKDWKRHLSTTKHQLDNKWITKKPQKTPVQHWCRHCGKKYKYSSGLSKHKKKCLNKPGEENERIRFLEKKVKELQEDKKINIKLMETINGLVNIQKDSNENLQKTLQDILPQIGNYNNNRISINVFLNDKCKDAMNLTDFLGKIKISIADLLYTKENGYSEGISNILLKHLGDMKPTERPFHCSDKKRLQFYVKEEDKWEKDVKHEKMNKTIQAISVKQIKHLKAWEDEHPGYLEDDELTKEWQLMIHKMMGGTEDVERMKNTEKIKKNLSNSVDVKDELINKD